jgi:two-component system sensor histidine kinase/response regulator
MASPHPPTDGRFRQAMRAASRERVIGEGPVAELFHVVLAALVVLLVAGRIPAALLAAWVVAVAAAVLYRGHLRRGLRDRELDGGTRRAFHVALAALALAWGVGAGLFSRSLPFADIALIVVVVSGVVAAATATLAADTLGFRLFLAGSIVPFAAGLLAGPIDRPRLIALVLMAVFSAAMVVLHQRAHAAIRMQVRTHVLLAVSEERLASERAHLNALFASAPVATVVVDAAGRILNVNPHFESLFGYTAHEARGALLNELIVPESERSDARRMDDSVLGGEVIVAEVQRRRKDGQLVSVRASAAPVEGSRERELFVLYEDVTDEVKARDALAQARDAAERAAQMRSAFLANMSHEIRTPMNAILGLTELLLDGDLAVEQRRSLGLIETSGEALLTLLNDILDLSKIEAESLHLEQISFDLPRLVESTVGLLAIRAHERDVELLTDIAPEVPEQVRGDPTRLRQVLTNLIGNAVKFTHHGEVVVSVAPVAASDGSARLRFAVRDTGIGIPEAEREAIFHPFSQADLSMSRKYGGTGLGLTIAQRLVAMMGGRLAVESEVGKGSEFSFALEFPVEVTLPAPVSAPDAKRLHGLRILVVDDNQSNRRIVREMLATAGVEVDEAADADGGLEAVRRAAQAGAPYALAILDAQMPGVDGFELAGTIRLDTALAATRLMMLTSAGQRGDAQRCRELGIRGYLTKPVSRADLFDMVSGVLAAEGDAGTGDVVTRHRIHESRRQLRILLAEDNPVNQEVAVAMLRKRGHQVTVAANGREAVAEAARARHDVVLMDVQMPEMDGIEATRAIRSLAGCADLPVVALTAHALPDERDRCLAAGMNAFVSKPFKAFELFAAAEGWARRTPEPPPVDLDAFRREMSIAGASEAVDGIVAGYVDGAAERIADIGQAVAAGEGEQAARLAHALKSSSAQIGARHLAELLQELEQAGVDGATDRMGERFEGVRTEMEKVVRYLKRD